MLSLSTLVAPGTSTAREWALSWWEDANHSCQSHFVAVEGMRQRTIRGHRIHWDSKRCTLKKVRGSWAMINRAKLITGMWNVGAESQFPAFWESCCPFLKTALQCNSQKRKGAVSIFPPSKHLTILLLMWLSCQRPAGFGPWILSEKSCYCSPWKKTKLKQQRNVGLEPP